MSLINKMLKDLDARAGHGAAGTEAPAALRPARAARRWPLLALGAGACVALLAAGGAAVYLAQRDGGPAPAVPPAPASRPAPGTPPVQIPQEALDRLAELAAQQRAANAAAAAGSKEETVAPVQDPKPEAEPEPAPAQAAVDAPPARRPEARKVPARPASAAPPQAAAPKRVQPPARAPARPAASPQGRVQAPSQAAEAAYRRALDGLAEGRVAEAIAGLRTALKADARHEAARQTLVGLLVESGRHEEAMRELQLALTLDPRQPALAMLLARLQIERGGPGIETLMRTLPYAAGKGDYHAFLAGALQREGRHREAAEHYGVALRTAPQNGVWWMGLGISLQAAQRNPEAASAFQRALDSGTLSAELQGFVERKLKQLAR